jgi:hypothetical protein
MRMVWGAHVRRGWRCHIYKDCFEEGAECPHDEMIVSGEVEIPGVKATPTKQRPAMTPSLR